MLSAVASRSRAWVRSRNRPSRGDNGPATTGRPVRSMRIMRLSVEESAKVTQVMSRTIRRTPGVRGGCAGVLEGFEGVLVEVPHADHDAARSVLRSV